MHDTANAQIARSNHRASSPPGWLKLSLPWTVLLLLAIWAGGRPPFALGIATLAAVLGLWINHPPLRRSSMFHWYAGCAILVMVVLTALPVPEASLTHNRARLHRQAQDSLATLHDVYPHPQLPEIQSHPALDAPKRAEAQHHRWFRTTLNYAGSMRFLLLFGGAWTMMWLTSALTGRQRHLFLEGVVIGGTLIATLALVGRHIAPFNNKVWWFIPVHGKVSASPFVNINHFASFCGMLVPGALSLIVGPVATTGRQRVMKQDRERSASSSARTSRRQLANKQRFLLRRSFFGICLAILIASTVLSLSRGGMLMMLAGCCVAAAVWIRGNPKAATIGTLLAISVLLAFLFWPSESVQREIGTLQFLAGASPKRVEMRTEALRQWKSFPLLGGGAESFRTLNGIYRSSASTRSPRYAENEYAQWLADFGYAGALIGIAFVATLAWLIAGHLYHNARSRRKFRMLMAPLVDHPKDIEPRIAPQIPHTNRTVVAAGVGAAAALLFHAACDFPIRVPLNAFLGGALVGLVLPLPLKPSRARGKYWLLRNTCFTAFFLAVTFFWHGPRLRMDDPDYLRHADIPELAQAIAYAPAYWVPWNELHERATQKAYHHAQAAASGNGTMDTQVEFVPMELYRYGVSCLERAAELNPSDYRMWDALAALRVRLGADDKEVRSAMRKAAVLEPKRHNLWLQWVKYEKQNGDFQKLRNVAELAAELAPRDIARRQWDTIRQIALNKADYATALDAVSRIVTLYPQSARWWKERAEIEQKLNRIDAAIGSLEKAAEVAPENWQLLMQLGKLLLRNDETDAANHVFTRAVRMRPELRDEIDEIWRKHQLR